MADEQNIVQPEVQTPDEGGNPPQGPGLNDNQRKELHGIITKMILNKEPEENIKLVINHYTQKNVAPQSAAQQPSSTPAFKGNVDFSNTLGLINGGGISDTDKHQGEVTAANDRIQNEFKTIDPAVKNILTDYKKQHEMGQIQDQLQQRGVDATANTALTDRISSLIPHAAIHVTDDEVQDFKKQMLENPDMARDALHEHAKLNPDKANQIAADTYLLDSKERAAGSNTKQILKNAEAIKNGDLEYSTWHGGAVTKPLGVIGSMVHGFKNREQQFNDYDFLANNKPEDIINEYEKRRRKPKNADEPVPTPAGLGGGFGNMVGDQGITMAKGALPSVLAAGTGGSAEAVAPWLGAVLTSPDFYEREYANSFNQNYNDLRDQGVNPHEALTTAQDRAAFDAREAVALGAVMTAVGGKVGLGSAKANFSPGFMGAVKGVAKQIAAATPEAATLGTAGGLAQVQKNLYSGKSAGEGVPDAFLNLAGLHLGITTLTAAGARALHPDLYKSALDNMAKQPSELVDKAIGEKVMSGEITPEQANDAHIIISDKKGQNEDLINKAKDIVAKGKMQGFSAEPLQHAALNDPEKFNSYLQNIAEQAHDPKTAEKTKEVYGEDLVNTAQQLYPHENVQELIKGNRENDLKEVDAEIKKLNPESTEYAGKKKELDDQKKTINTYYDNYGKHQQELNSPKTDNNETEQTGQPNAQTGQAEEVANKGAAPQEPAPFSNQQQETAKNLLQQGVQNGTIPKEYEGMADHPEHLLNYIKEEIGNGKEADMTKEFGKDLVQLSQSEASYPIVRNIKPKTDALQIVSPSSEVSLPTSTGENIPGSSEGVGSSEQGNEATGTQPETQSTNQGQEKVKPEDDLPFRDEPGDESVTGIRNKITSKKIEEAGLTPALKEVKRTHPEVWEEALNKVKKGYDTQTLVDQLKNKPRPLTDTEDALLLIHQVDKESQLDAVNRDITEAGQKGDEAALAELHIQKAKIKDDLQDIYDVDKAVGTANARGLSARQMISDRRYSLVSMENEALALKEGKPLTAEEKEAIEKRYNDIKDARDAIQKRVDELEAENKQLKAKKVVAAEKKETAKEPKKSKGDYAKQRDEIVQKMRADLLRAAKGGEGLTASIPFAAQLKAVAPHIAKLVKSYIAQGIDSIEQITKEIHALLSPSIPGLTESHVHDLIAGDFNEAKPKGTPSKAAEIKEQAKQIKYAVTDPQLMKLRATYEREKESWGDATRKKEMANRGTAAKVQDTFVKWQRAFKLSGITTLAKLGMAGATRLASTPVENAVGEAYRTVLPGIGKKATIEGGLDIKAEAKAITSAFTQGMKDSAAILSKKSRGQSDIEAVFGKGGNLPPEAIGFFGQLHSAIKAPIKRAAFERALYSQIAAGLKAGVDVSDPMVQSKMAIRAYKSGQRAIFMQDNFISDGYKNFVASLERSKKFPAQGKATATALQWLIPFVKVPTNIVGEVGTNVAGVPIAAGKILHTAFTKGLDKLSDDEADMIFRNLKKGSIGAGALLLGYFNPQSFGGYYQKYEKREAGDLKAGQARVFGKTIPAWLLESPIFQTMELGATVRRVKDKIVKGQPQGINEGVWAGALGLVEHEPLVDQPSRIAGAITDSKERQYFLGELAKSAVVPAAVSNIAQWTDPADSRSPGTIVEHVETGIPGLREQVGEKAAPKAKGGRKKGGIKREHRR